MKKLMIMMLMLGTFASCTKNTETPEVPEMPKEKEVVKLDPFAKVYVKCQLETKAEETEYKHETPEYIVTNATFVGGKRYSNYEKKVVETIEGLGYVGELYNEYRDFENNRFVFGREWAVVADREPVIPGTIFGSENNVFMVGKIDGKRVHPSVFDQIPPEGFDTVAYIPNAVVKQLQKDLLKYMAEGNIEECDRIFKERFVYIPCSGKEYKDLKAKGLN